MYSKDLHRKLLSYTQLAESLENPYVDKFHVFGISAHDLSGMSIHKTGEPFDKNGSAALITIREIMPDFTPNSLVIKEFPELDSDNKIIRNTDYVMYPDGTFSEPDQVTTIFSPDRYNNLTVLNELGKLSNLLMKKYIELDKIGADDLELSNIESKLSQTYKEFDKIFTEERVFYNALGSYDDQEHDRLCRKLGSLILF